ncbi:EamA family transporter [Flavitalea sp. BT771]|uniref:EamA family transporter n=1 Tax=Flavitalea sp. BT771 TaxID=3063329 RepID=UPI0026E30DC0|nr:EamA family transporter [Flavitalea sp. BT771]MDO6434866.1 EamA family transporter [Flavitalea sp. BT771]MDV6223766.1 EamA family transporter [Flavitalea sp. BT771]
MNTKKILIILAFIAIYFIWGTTYLANLFGLQGMKPFVLSTLRYTAAAVILLVWCFVRRLSFPKGGQLKVLAISGLLMLGGGAGFVVIGEQYINSGHAAVIIATEPLLFLLMDKKSWRTNFSDKWMLTGLLLGFTGIFMFSRFTAATGTAMGGVMETIKGTVLVLLSSVFWVSGTLYARRHQVSHSSGVADAAVQHLAAAIACCVIALSQGEWGSFSPSEIPTTTWGALAFLVVMGSLVAFIAFSWLIKVRPPAIVSTHTYVNPVVAVVIGCLIAKEQIAPMQIAALVMVLAGVVLTAMKKTSAL